MTEITSIRPDDIISEFEYLRNWLNEDDTYQVAEYHLDEFSLHLYVTKIFTPDWMDHTYLYNLTIDGESIEGDWETMAVNLLFMKPLELVVEQSVWRTA